MQSVWDNESANYIIVIIFLFTLRLRLNGLHFADNISNAFSWIKTFKFQIKFYWNKVLKV